MTGLASNQSLMTIPVPNHYLKPVQKSQMKDDQLTQKIPWFTANLNPKKRLWRPLHNVEREFKSLPISSFQLSQKVREAVMGYTSLCNDHFKASFFPLLNTRRRQIALFRFLTRSLGRKSHVSMVLEGICEAKKKSNLPVSSSHISKWPEMHPWEFFFE